MAKHSTDPEPEPLPVAPPRRSRLKIFGAVVVALLIGSGLTYGIADVVGQGCTSPTPQSTDANGVITEGGTCSFSYSIPVTPSAGPTITVPGPTSTETDTATVTAPGPTSTVTVTTSPTTSAPSTSATSTPTVTTTVTTSTPPPPPNGPNCIAKPSACGFPDATNSGVPVGTTLTPYTGPSTITTAGTVINGKLITTQLTINANNVVIENSELLNPSSNTTIASCQSVDCAAIVYLNAASGGGVYNSYISGNGYNCSIGVEARGGQQVVGNNISGCGDAVREASLMQGNYLHDFWLDGRVNGACVDTPHNDGYQTLGISGATIEDNTIINPTDGSNSDDCQIGSASAGIDSCVYFGDQSQASKNDLVQGNLFDCNSFQVRLSKTSQNMKVLTNRFVNVPGMYGYLLTYNNPSYTFTGNVNDATNAAITG